LSEHRDNPDFDDLYAMLARLLGTHQPVKALDLKHLAGPSSTPNRLSSHRIGYSITQAGGYLKGRRAVLAAQGRSLGFERIRPNG